jgi:hypothetical protein
MAKLKEAEIIQRLDDCFDLLEKTCGRLNRLKQAFGRLSPEVRERYLNDLEWVKDDVTATEHAFIHQDLKTGLEALSEINRKHNAEKRPLSDGIEIDTEKP